MKPKQINSEPLPYSIANKLRVIIKQFFDNCENLQTMQNNPLKDVKSDGINKNFYYWYCFGEPFPGNGVSLKVLFLAKFDIMAL